MCKAILSLFQEYHSTNITDDSLHFLSSSANKHLSIAKKDDLVVLLFLVFLDEKQKGRRRGT